MSGHGLKIFAAIPALSLAAALILGSAALAQNAVRVGAPLPLTGPLSPEGVKQKEGYDLWAETANAKGGITVGGKTYKVEIVYVDYASNTPRAVQAAERLINDDKVNRRTFDQMIADGLKSDPSAAESQMLHAIDDWTRDARLSPPNVKRERMEQDKQFGRIVFRVNGSGNMASIARFLWDVQTSKLPTHIVDLQISSRQGSKEGSDDLSLNVAISTLVRGQVPATSPSAPNATVALNTKEPR